MASEKKWIPDAIVLGPGGINGYLELGALFYFEKEGYLNKYHTIVGVSVGSLIGLLLISGYHVAEIIIQSCALSLFHNQIIDFTKIATHSGIFSHDIIRKEISALLYNKLGIIPTLEQLYQRSGINFIIVTTDIEDNGGTAKYISHETDPKLSVVDAVLYSCNIPVIFYKIWYREHLCIDGIFSNPYPIDIVDNGKNEVLGIWIDTKVELSNNLFVYLYQSASVPINQLYKKNVSSSSSKCHHLVLKTENTDIMGIITEPEAKKDLIKQGLNQAQIFISGRAETANRNNTQPLNNNELTGIVDMIKNRDQISLIIKVDR